MQTQRASWKKEGRWLVVSGDLERERLLRVSIASASASASASKKWVVGCGLWVVGSE